MAVIPMPHRITVDGARTSLVDMAIALERRFVKEKQFRWRIDGKPPLEKLVADFVEESDATLARGMCLVAVLSEPL